MQLFLLKRSLRNSRSAQWHACTPPGRAGTGHTVGTSLRLPSRRKISSRNFLRKGNILHNQNSGGASAARASSADRNFV